MTRRWRHSGWVVAIVMAASSVAAAPPPSSAGDRQSTAGQEQKVTEDRAFTGQFEGSLIADNGGAPVSVGLEVKAGTGGAYAATLYYGGLPGKAGKGSGGAAAGQKPLALTGIYRDFTLVLTGKTPLRFQYIHGRYTALDAGNNYRGHLARVIPGA